MRSIWFVTWGDTAIDPNTPPRPRRTRRERINDWWVWRFRPGVADRLRGIARLLHRLHDWLLDAAWRLDGV